MSNAQPTLDNMQFRQSRLYKLRIGLQQRLSEEILDPRVEFDENSLINDVVLHVRGYIWRDGNDYNRTIRYPADWWQAFKERWFPVWLLRLTPIRYTAHEINASVIYPSLKINVPPEYPYRYLIDVRDDEYTDDDLAGDYEEPLTWWRRLEKVQGWA